MSTHSVTCTDVPADSRSVTCTNMQNTIVAFASLTDTKGVRIRIRKTFTITLRFWGRSETGDYESELRATLWRSGQKQVEGHYISSDPRGGDVSSTRYKKINDTFTHGIYFYQISWGLQCSKSCAKMKQAWFWPWPLAYWEVDFEMNVTQVTWHHRKSCDRLFL
jgi:hypothetical protein